MMKISQISSYLLVAMAHYYMLFIAIKIDWIKQLLLVFIQDILAFMQIGLQMKLKN